MKLLLIQPKLPESFWSFSWAFRSVMRDKRAAISPLGLATVAALTPPTWDVTILDENIEPIDWDTAADVVGICGMAVQYPRQREIAEEFRRRGKFVVVGGSYASLCPEEFADCADSVVAGEAEYIWPQFCADFEKGCPRSLYRETGTVDLTDSPLPRHDLLKLQLYQCVAIQFSRGCPFRCEFCDIIVTFGRKPRAKSLAQVERELDLLRSLGIRNVFFIDDNLIGHLPRCRELLDFLADYQARHRYRFTFGAETSANLAAQPSLTRRVGVGDTNQTHQPDASARDAQPSLTRRVSVGDTNQTHQPDASARDAQPSLTRRVSVGDTNQTHQPDASARHAQPSLLEQFRRANFQWVFIGLETPSREALTEARKEQNNRADPLSTLRAVYAHGIDVYASFVVGFDADDASIFDRQYEFIVESGILIASVALLLALPRTPLHERLAREGRLRATAGNRHQLWNNLIATNVVPLRMTDDELITGFRQLLARLADDSAIERRIRNKMRWLGQTPLPFGLGRLQTASYFLRFLLRGVFVGGPRRWFYFARSLRGAIRKPRYLPFLVQCWVHGIAVQDFIKRHLKETAEPEPRKEDALTPKSGNRVLYSHARPF